MIGNNVIPNRRVNSDITWGLSQNVYPLESCILFWRISIYFIKGPHADAIYLGTHPRFLSGRGLKIFISSSWRLGNFKFLRDLIFFSIIESLSKFKNCLQQSLFLYVYAKFYWPYLEIFSLTAESCNIMSVEVSIQTPKNCLILFVRNSLKDSIFGQKLSESVSIVWFKCRNLCLLLVR